MADDLHSMDVSLEVPPLSPLKAAAVPDAVPDAVPAVLVAAPKMFKDEGEFYPRWFETKDNRCDDECYVCARMKAKKQYNKGTFGVVTLHDTHAVKSIPARDGNLCASALREMTAYSLLGSSCPQTVHCVQEPEVDAHGQVLFHLERAECSLLDFSRCLRVRHALPGWDNMSVHFVLWSLLKAVVHLNQCHLMHRDLKPNNIVLFAGPRVALCDFGGCRLTTAELSDLEVVMSDVVCTKHYAPPEEDTCKHTLVFDSFSIAATVMHYAMSCAPMYQPLNKNNRKQFIKWCKPYPRLLTILRLLVRLKPKTRYTAAEALDAFENMLPAMVQKFKSYNQPKAPAPCFQVSPLSAHNKHCSWDRFHHFTNQVWPATLECIRVCQQTFKNDFVFDKTACLAVAFYVLNMLQNLLSISKEVCYERTCYVMYLPCFVRTACLLAGDADTTEDYIKICFQMLERHKCVAPTKGGPGVISETILAAQRLPKVAVNWIYPSNLETLIELQNEFHL